MRKIARTIAFAIAIGMLLSPAADARGRNDANERSRTEQHSTSRSHGRQPQGSKRPDNHNRPGNARPGNARPGNARPTGEQKKKPDNHAPATNRPQPPTRPHQPAHPHQPMRPHQPTRPQPPTATQHRPSHNHHFTPPRQPQHMPPRRRPPRPMMPANRPWHRPTPPPSFRPAPGWRPFSSILGIALGSAINISINGLINAGYNVSGYGNDAVYVTDAPMLNMVWPDATLYYGNGGLYASEFVYSTPAYNLSRYNSAYRTLVRNYGSPIQSTNVGGSITSTWWGPGNQFIRLTFQSAIAGNGSNRFFTTLSFGN